MSHLREHKFKYNFQDLLNPICSCDLDIKSFTHFLLHSDHELFTLMSTLNKIYCNSLELLKGFSEEGHHSLLLRTLQSLKQALVITINKSTFLKFPPNLCFIFQFGKTSENNITTYFHPGGERNQKALFVCCFLLAFLNCFNQPLHFRQCLLFFFFFTILFLSFPLFLRFENIVQIICNQLHIILRLFDVLPIISFTTSETICGYYLQTWYMRAASRVAGRLNTQDLRKLGNIKKLSKIHRMLAQCPVSLPK